MFLGKGSGDGAALLFMRAYYPNNVKVKNRGGVRSPVCERERKGPTFLLQGENALLREGEVGRRWRG